LFDKQDEVIPIGNYLKYIFKDPSVVTDLCSLVTLHRKLSSMWLPDVQN